MSQADPTEGFIYVLSNPSMQGRVKIGRSSRPAEDRAAELSASTGVPQPFLVEHWERVVNYVEAESLIHFRLDPVRLPGREFFRMSVSSAIRVVAEVCTPRRVPVFMPGLVEEGPCPFCGSRVTFAGTQPAIGAFCVQGHLMRYADLPVILGRDGLPVRVDAFQSVNRCVSCGGQLRATADYWICEDDACGYIVRQPGPAQVPDAAPPAGLRLVE